MCGGVQCVAVLIILPKVDEMLERQRHRKRTTHESPSQQLIQQTTTQSDDANYMLLFSAAV